MRATQAPSHLCFRLSDRNPQLVFHPSGDGSPGASDGGGRGGGRPFIAALAISKARGDLPGPGFFDCARRLGRFAGDPDGQDARTFHAAELNAVFACWSGSGDN
jgi:hypothetical protein